MKKTFRYNGNQERYNVKDQIMEDAITRINENTKEARDKQDQAEAKRKNKYNP